MKKTPRQKLILPLEQNWAEKAGLAAADFALGFGFSEEVTGVIAESVTEAGRAIIQASAQVGLEAPFQVELGVNDHSLEIKISYDRKTPLDLTPPKASLPEDKKEEVDAAYLLARLLTKQMDKVAYGVEGNIRYISLSKYPRGKGKEGQYWVMDLIPALRSDLRIDYIPGSSPELPSGAVVTDPRTGQGLRFDQAGAFVISRMDGKRKCYDMYLDYVDLAGPISPRRVGMIYETLEDRGLLAGQDRPQPGRLSRILHAVVGLNLVFKNADSLVARMHRRLGFLTSTLGLIAMFALGVSGAIPLIEHWDKYLGGLHQMGGHFLDYTWLWVLLYGLIVASSIVHELGHAFVCKRFGGSVNGMGAMFYVSFIIFYCDVSSAWIFLKRRHRVLVALGGPFVSFALLGLFMWLIDYNADSQGPWFHFWVYAAVFILASLIMNFNPFLRMDAYYMLMEGLNIPNLRERSFAHIKMAVLRLFLGDKLPPQPSLPSRKERIAFWVYGISGCLVTVVFFGLPLMHFSAMVIKGFNWLEIVISAGISVLMILIQAARYFWIRYQALQHRQIRLS
ncbi:M50 family metallopeptidase [Dethiosulfatarculus sandiegensis]|uniref:Peptidase M50 n=1 Tax=Dethiosulfatarculus sandiegensis TaxID=1429043 RepID=A0A0D2HV98_9BACT|nr:M50 family metallopeptidase [Dethiosulfatarculus sandiegensis]KIX14338.1 hypothetical protein X474_08750 [Dethiosulfatarculus sandiegensis]